ncbi:MAG: hypothetical protein J0M02_02270 [Planctomycetes bacterium]|nr:hypothetical protein [Planctomycetota bacterium]
MSAIADLRHDHRHLMSIAVSLSASPPMTAVNGDHLRYRVDSLRRHLADHLLREASCFNSIASSVVGKARRAEAEAVEHLVTAFSAKWRTTGVIESDPNGYALAVADLRLRLDRLVRREEDCMFALLDGGNADHMVLRADECRCPVIRSALGRTVAALDALRADLLAGHPAIPQRIVDLRDVVGQLLASESTAMATCMPAGPVDMADEGARLLGMLQEVTSDATAGRLHIAAEAVEYIGRWIHVHVTECEVQLARYGYQQPTVRSESPSADTPMPTTSDR